MAERHMDKANWKWRWGEKKPWKRRRNKLQLSPNITFRPKSWPAPILSLVDTIHDWCIFRKEKKNPSIGWVSKHLFSIPLTIRNHSLHLFFNFVFACEQNWSWQKTVHVNYLNNSFSLCWITLRLLAVKSCHSPVTVEDIVIFFHAHRELTHFSPTGMNWWCFLKQERKALQVQITKHIHAAS